MTKPNAELTPEQARLLAQFVQSLGDIEHVVVVFERDGHTAIISGKRVNGFPMPKAVA